MNSPTHSPLHSFALIMRGIFVGVVALLAVMPKSADAQQVISAPGNLVAAGGPAEIVLTWDAPTGAIAAPVRSSDYEEGVEYILSYDIEVSLDEGATFNLERTTSRTNLEYTSTGLSDGATRHYRVRANLNSRTEPAGSGETDWSNVASATTAVVEAGIEQAVSEGDSVTLDGSGSTPDLNYRWTQTLPLEGPGAQVPLRNADTLMPTFFAPPQLLTDVALVFQLAVFTNDQSNAITDTVTISVSAGNNDVPRADAGPNQFALAGQTVTLDASLSFDLEGQDLIYEWLQTAGRQVDLVNRTEVRARFVFPTPTEDTMLGDIDMRALVFRVVVSDGTNLSADVVTIMFRSSEVEATNTLLPEVARAVVAANGAIPARIQKAANVVGRGLVPQFRFGGEVGQAQSLDEVLRDSEFVLPLHGHRDGYHGVMAVWGGGDVRNFNGEGEFLDWDGELTAYHLGFDVRLGGGFLIGLAASSMALETDYNFAQLAENRFGDGRQNVDLQTITPYFGWSANGGSVWASYGTGNGEMEFVADGNTFLTNDLNINNVSVGGEGVLHSGGNAAFILKGEVSQTTLEIDDQSLDPDAREFEVQRSRLAVQYGNSGRLSGGSVFEPLVEVAARFDDGDGETGGGGELGGGIKYHSATKRVIAEVSARTLLFYTGESEDWGIQGNLRMQPGLDGQGFSFNVSPRYGDAGNADDVGNVDRIEQVWQSGVGDVGDDTHDYAMQFDARLGYGLSLRDGLGGIGGRITPYSEMRKGQQADVYRMGVNWSNTLGGIGKSRMNLDLRNERRESDNSVLLEGSLSF